MATVNLLLRTKKNPANINIRFTNGRAIDLFSKINVFVDPKNWDKKNGKIRNVIDVPNRDSLNIKFAELKIFVLNEFNANFMEGEIIDKEWLDKTVNNFFKRPKGEKNKKNDTTKIYFLNFCIWWLDNKSSTWKTTNNKYMDESTKKQYRSHLEIIKKYEAFTKKRIKLKDVSEEKIKSLISYMEETEGYEYNTVKRHIGRFKFFCGRAEADNIDINNNFKERYFATKTEEVMEPYLNEAEIEKIFKQDFSHDEVLDGVRDNFIIGLWTGLRVSDFNNHLDTSNIKDDFIEIKTEKTDTWVSIPVHPQIRFILDKRCGLLPEKLSDQKFNKHIKTICQICNIDNEMRGKLFDADTKRNKIDIYPKYKLVSSHICRRSFATNLYGLVSNSVIQAVGGWSTEKMMLNYIKKTKREHAEILRDTWNKKYNLK